jgi:hypothetical protein
VAATARVKVGRSTGAAAITKRVSPAAEYPRTVVSLAMVFP